MAIVVADTAPGMLGLSAVLIGTAAGVISGLSAISVVTTAVVGAIPGLLALAAVTSSAVSTRVLVCTGDAGLFGSGDAGFSGSGDAGLFGSGNAELFGSDVAGSLGSYGAELGASGEEALPTGAVAISSFGCTKLLVPDAIELAGVVEVVASGIKVVFAFREVWLSCCTGSEPNASGDEWCVASGDAASVVSNDEEVAGLTIEVTAGVRLSTGTDPPAVVWALVDIVLAISLDDTSLS